MFRRLEADRGARLIQSTNITKYWTRQKSSHSTGPWCQSCCNGHVMHGIHGFDGNRMIETIQRRECPWIIHMILIVKDALWGLLRVAFLCIYAISRNAKILKALLLQPIPYSVRIVWQFVHVLFCNFRQFSCLKLFCIRDQFFMIFAFDLFRFFCLVSKGWEGRMGDLP